MARVVAEAATFALLAAGCSASPQGLEGAATLGVLHAYRGRTGSARRPVTILPR